MKDYIFVNDKSALCIMPNENSSTQVGSWISNPIFIPTYFPKMIRQLQTYVSETLKHVNSPKRVSRVKLGSPEGS